MIAAKQASCQQAAAEARASQQQQPRVDEEKAAAAAARRTGDGPSKLRSPQMRPLPQEAADDETRSERLPLAGWPTLLASSQPNASAKIQLKQQRFLAAAAKSASSPRRQQSPHPQHCRQVVAAAVATAKAQAQAKAATAGAASSMSAEAVAVSPTAATSAEGALSPSGDRQQHQQRARPKAEAALTTSAPILIEVANQEAEAEAATTNSQQQLEAEGCIVRGEAGECAETEEEDNKNKKTTRETTETKVSERDNENHNEFYSDAKHNDKASVVTEQNSDIGSLASLLQTSHHQQHNHHQQHQDSNLLSSSNNNDINDYHRHRQPQQQQQNILHYLNQNHHQHQTTTSHSNHHFHHNHSINNNCANNIIKTPTTRQQLQQRQPEANLINHHKEPITTPIANNNNTDNNFNPSSTSIAFNNLPVGLKSSSQNNNNTFITNSAANNQLQQPRQQFHNFNINNSHHYNQQPQHNNMAHYKFHNDCQSSVLTYEQVKRLDFVMDQTVPIHGRGNFPTLYVKLKELIRLVKYKLQKEHSIEIRDVRLNGGAANYVLAPENSHYNDLDLVFGTDLSNEDQFDVIRDVVLECLKEFFPKPHRQRRHASSNGHDADEFVCISGIKKLPETDAASTLTNYNRESPPESFLNQEGGSCLMSLYESDNLKITIKQNDEDDDGSKHENEDANQQQGGQASENVEKTIVGLSERRTGSDCNEIQAENTQTMHESVNDMTELQRQRVENSSSRPIQNSLYQHAQSYQMPLSNCAMKEAYVHKMVKVNDDDRWSLISLGVQQSETNCCNQIGCSASTIQRVNQQLSDHQLQQQLVSEIEPQELINSNKSTASTATNEKSNAQSIVNENTQHYQATSYLHSQHQHKRNHYQQHQQKQFPNSIELKFVDRMRRKFEFSVDSFQIILDSLIQFYDYAPQSTITSQRKLISSHPSSTMINTRPLINKRRCSGCCGNQTALDTDSVSLSKTKMHRGGEENFSHRYQSMGGFPGVKSCAPTLNSSRSYYQLPIEPANSLSISSVASSSGCSSSSSVVSSSSSSLSCDEDHEDLYCDADSPSSSSASTSSLLSSTSFMLSSDGSSCGASDSVSHRKSSQPEILEVDSSTNQQRNQNRMDDSKSSLKSEACKIESTHLAMADSNHSYRNPFVGCVECLGQRNLSNSIYHFETDNKTSCAVISENFYPTVIGRSEYGNFKEALYHLEKKLIATRSPEEIRGGGLLKYCNLLVKNYKPTNVYQIRTLERYMCSRFFIDFSDLNQQQAKLESYLANHFSDDPILKFDYLTILHNVVQRSTVCLMNHELRLTLNMIRDLAYKLNEQQQQHQQRQQRQQQNQQQQQHVEQQSSQTQVQQEQHYYQQHEPVLIQSGVYRVKLVNYTLAKTVRPS